MNMYSKIFLALILIHLLLHLLHQKLLLKVMRLPETNAWVQNQLKEHFPTQFVFKGDEKNDKRISRFGRSRDDFCFFLKPGVGQHLAGASVSEVSEEVELTIFFTAAIFYFHDFLELPKVATKLN